MKICACLVLLGTIVSLQTNLSAGFVFSNKQSAVRLRPGATFASAAAIVDWGGTLISEVGSTVDAPSLGFAGGRFESSSQPDSYIEGTFSRVSDNPTYGDILTLQGQEMTIDGPVAETVLIIGSGNLIAGSPSFDQNIVLQNGSSELSLEMRSIMEKNIILNGGTLILNDSLFFERNGRILGDGAIWGNDHTISMGGGEWDADLIFHEETSVQINETMELAATWTFSGVNSINGNGNILDLSHPLAEIHIDVDSVLTIRDLFVHQSNLDKITFGNENSELRFSNAFLSIDSDIHSEIGNIIIEGPTTFYMGLNDWIFTNQATMEVESAMLWIDAQDRIEDPLFGQVTDAGSFVSYINGSTVKQLIDRGEVFSSSMRLLLSGFVSTTVFLDQNILMKPDDIIRFVGDSYVSSSGSGITFAGVGDPQFVIKEGVEVTFNNTNFLRTYDSTFDIEDGGILNFESNMGLELAEDLTFTHGDFNSVGVGDQFTFSGLGGNKRLTFGPPDEGREFSWDLGANTLNLQDVTLSGLNYINFSEGYIGDQFYYGAIALNGNSIIEIDRDTTMNFIIQGINNEIRLLNNDLNLDGRITFGTASNNTVKITFELTNEVAQLRLNFGENAVTLEAENGRAGLLFDDYDVVVNNKFPTSIEAYSRSYLGGERITIETNPIKQLSSDFSLESALELLTELDNPIDSSEIRGSGSFFRYEDSFTTAFNRLRGNNSKEFRPYAPADTYFRSALSRALKIPNPNLRIKKLVKMGAARGPIRLERGGGLTSFAPHPTEPLTLELAGGARVITQTRRSRRAARPVRATTEISDELKDILKKEDQVFISGTDNKFIVTGNLEIKGDLFIDEEAELIFEFDDSIDSEKTISIGNPESSSLEEPLRIELPKSSSLVFQGNGEVRFISGTIIDCQGTPLTEIEEAEDGTYDDDRPSLIFKSHAKLVLDNDRLLEVGGHGIVLFQDYAQANIESGHLIIGLEHDDFFDLTVDRNASLRLGAAVENTQQSVIAASTVIPEGRISLPSGAYNILFNRAAQLLVRQGGVFETSLLNSDYFGGLIYSFICSGEALISLTNGGILAFGQNNLDSSTDLLPWNNTNGTVEGDGFIEFYLEQPEPEEKASVVPAIEPVFRRVIQKRFFESVDQEAEGIATTLSTVTPGLSIAFDYVDEFGNYKLHFIEDNITVDLQSGDVVKFDDPANGTVYLLDANGKKWGVSSNGKRFITRRKFST